MSKLSFTAFCIEFYAEHTGLPDYEVYIIFKNEGLLDLLDTDYEDLHGMGMEYLMRFFDEYLKTHMNHTLVRATIIPEIVE